MSFTRSLYDTCATDLQVNRSTGPGAYKLYSGYGNNINKCYPKHSIRGSKNEVAAPKNCDTGIGNRIAIESCLHNRSKVLSECNSNNCDLSKYQSKMIFNNDCDNTRYTQDTRFTHPVDSYRGMSLTSYFMNPYLHLNPQGNIPCNNSSSSRLIAKDTYKMPTQNMWNTSVLPKPHPDKDVDLSLCNNKQ